MRLVGPLTGTVGLALHDAPIRKFLRRDNRHPGEGKRCESSPFPVSGLIEQNHSPQARLMTICGE
jgi:hypothetical protein